MELNLDPQESSMGIDRASQALFSRTKLVFARKMGSAVLLEFFVIFSHIFRGRGASVLQKLSDGIEPHFKGVLNGYR